MQGPSMELKKHLMPLEDMVNSTNMILGNNIAAKGFEVNYSTWKIIAQFGIMVLGWKTSIIETQFLVTTISLQKLNSNWLVVKIIGVVFCCNKNKN